MQNNEISTQLLLKNKIRTSDYELTDDELATPLTALFNEGIDTEEFVDYAAKYVLNKLQTTLYPNSISLYQVSDTFPAHEYAAAYMRIVYHIQTATLFTSIAVDVRADCIQQNYISMQDFIYCIVDKIWTILSDRRDEFRTLDTTEFRKYHFSLWNKVFNSFNARLQPAE